MTRVSAVIINSFTRWGDFFNFTFPPSPNAADNEYAAQMTNSTLSKKPSLSSRQQSRHKNG